MGKTLSETVRRPGRRWSAIVLTLLACVVIAGCAQRGTSAQEERQGGFYGGISAGGDM